MDDFDKNDVFFDWNKLTLDQKVEYLRNKYRFISSGEANCINSLIGFYDERKNN
jgi:hypothetical protein